MTHQYEKFVVLFPERRRYYESPDAPIDMTLGLRETGHTTKVGRIVWEDFAEGSYPEPSFRLQDREAQELMNRLWDLGVRPAQAAGSAGQLASVQAHLEDMRKIALDATVIYQQLLKEGRL